MPWEGHTALPLRSSQNLRQGLGSRLGACLVARLARLSLAKAGEGLKGSRGSRLGDLGSQVCLEGSGFPTGAGNSRLEFWGPPSSPGKPLLPGPRDPGVLAGEGGSPAGVLPNPAACSPGILLLRDGKSRPAGPAAHPSPPGGGGAQRFLPAPAPPPISGQGPPRQWEGLGGPGQASKAQSHVLEPCPARSGHQGTLESE